MSRTSSLRLAAYLFVGAAALGGSGPAWASNFDVVIHHSELQETGIRPKVGDTITFINQAEISHNLYLTYEDGHVETLDTQIPHSTKTAVLHTAGKVVVRCWIHPIIRLEMTVAGGG